ncbi:hypothetical protein E2C01_052773 [Portunus trituberculatus]|uniref:Uncharacterized protein n=1 Tax=Portunus trituberculatus TaxID=210409 RepID=A0A5B7GQ91_PORTR|nr:hypothetical protein [Portunus trituberculatus]
MFLCCIQWGCGCKTDHRWLSDSVLPAACAWAWRVSIGSHCLSSRESYDPKPPQPRDLHLAAPGRRIQLLDETKRSRSVFFVSCYGGN